MNFFRCVKNSNDTFLIHESILKCLKNIREFFQFDRMSNNNCEIVDHPKVYRVTLTQSVFQHYRKNRCVLQGLNAFFSKNNFSPRLI